MTSKGCRFNHLSFKERKIIERMYSAGFSKIAIANAIGYSISTIYNELKRGYCKQLTYELKEKYIYSPELAQTKYDKELKNRGLKPKILKDELLCEYIRFLIVKRKLSPESVILQLKRTEIPFKVKIKSPNTIYKAIREGYIKGVKMGHLEFGNRGYYKRKKVVKVKKEPRGLSIEKRDESIKTRSTFGNWEMDTVKGKITNKKCLLVLTERKTRYEIIEPMKYCTADEVRKAINRLEKRYGCMFYSVFKTITVDNGSEFAKYLDIEKSLYRKGNRTTVYYCHPNSPHERGSNENANKFIRRFYKKGSDFDKKLNKRKIKAIEDYINLYPRNILNGMTAKELFQIELNNLGFT